MSYFLAKTEPHEYSIDDLKRDVKIPWTGVNNPQAKSFLCSMKVGDKVFIYHSGEKTVAGLAEVTETGEVPVFKFIEKFKSPLVTLSEIKNNSKFSQMKLVRQSRLSVMEVPDIFTKWILK